MQSENFFPTLNPSTVEFLSKKRKKRQAITFDEITLQDLPSNFHPSDVCLQTNITRKISLKSCGILSAAMDTVTEAQMALAMAQVGGMGIIHRNLSAEEQASQVQWVRKKINFGGCVDKPYTFKRTDHLSTLQDAIASHGWPFTSFPIVDDEGKLQGLITRDEMDFVESGNPQLEAIMKPRDSIVTAQEGITNDQAYSIMKEKKVKKLPVVNDKDQLKGLYVWNDVKNDQRKRNCFSIDEEGHFLVGAAVGFDIKEMERVKLLVEVGCKVIVLDSSHGACSAAREQIARIKILYGDKVELIVGNIASYESAMYLLESDHKPDALKVGIGPGSICTTRQVTGHGVPQVSAIFNVWMAVQDYGAATKYYVPVIADGGVRTSGDMVKCFAAGASGIMLGSALAGATESPGIVVKKGNKDFKTIRGMGSRSAMESRAGSRIRYHRNQEVQDDKGTQKETDSLSQQQKIKMVPEGVEGLVEYKGSLENIVYEYLGGVQSGIAHSGGNSIPSFQKKAEIWIQSFAGTTEGKPHSVVDISS